MRYLYSILFYIALPFLFLRLLWRSRLLPAYKQRWAERLGFCPYRLEQCILIHAVSLGETIAVIPLIKALQVKYPQHAILVTNMTPTGSMKVRTALSESVFNAYLPYDLPDMCARFLNRVHPSVVVIMETELWPNFFAACKKRRIPIVVTNARLSEKSAQGYRHFTPLIRNMLSAVAQLAAQSQADADRFIALGMPKERIQVTGNIKFDLELAVDLSVKAELLRHQLGKDRFVWIAASTHLGEEEVMLAAHRMLQEKYPRALLILVPRHPERADSVAMLVAEKKFMMARRSQTKIYLEDIDVYLGDTMGEMMLLFAAADVSCVAGSFVAIGGHNIIEPAALHKPILTGPHLFNFTEISELMFSAGGMYKVVNADELASKLIAFAADETYRQQVGEKAFSVVASNRGALQQQLALVSKCYSEAGKN